jgi:hypothetical protein
VGKQGRTAVRALFIFSFTSFDICGQLKEATSTKVSPERLVVVHTCASYLYPNKLGARGSTP